MTDVDTSPAWWTLGAVGATPRTHPAATLRDSRPELLVVGLGASGLTACLAAARRGAEVVGVDAVGIGGGASGANGGFLLAGTALFHDDAVARHGHDVALAWYRRTLEELDRAVDEEPTFRRVGSLRTAVDEAEFAAIEAHRAALERDGIAVERYEGPEGRGILVPSDGAFDPAARCVRLAREAVAAGARLVAPARVANVDAGAVGLTGGVVVEAPRVLVAVDGGVERVVPGLAGEVRTARLQMLATAPQRGLAVLDRPTYHRYGLDYAQQVGDRVLLGGGRDVGGDAEWTTSGGTSPPVQAHLEGWLRRLGVTAPVTHRWSATSAWTSDRLPIDHEVLPGVRVVGGYSGHGNLIGPMLARGAVDALLG